MLRATVLDGDQVAAGRHGGVADLVALATLLTVHLDFGRTVDGDGQRSGAGVTGVHDEL